MKKRLLSGLLSVALVVPVLCFNGCQKKEKTGDVVTVHWYMQKPVSDMSRQEEVEKEANKIIYEKLGVKLKFHFIEAASWQDKMNVMLSSGRDYDIITTASAQFINNAQKNSFADIGDSLDKYGKTIKEKVDDFAWSAVKYNNKIVGIPAQTFYVPYSAFAFKKDLVDKYNFDYQNASTYDAIEPFLKEVKESEPGITGMAVVSNSSVSMPKTANYSTTNIDFIYYDNLSKEFKVKYDIADIDSGNRKIDEFAKKGYISSDAISKNELVSEMKSGKYAVVSGRRSAEKSSNLYGYECVEAEPTYGVVSTVNVINSVNAISAHSKHIDEAIKVLNLIWEDSYLSNTLAYGIEGKDYTVDKGDVHNYKDINEIHITTNSGTNVKWSIWHNWLGPLWDQWDSPWNTRESLEKMMELNETSEKSPILGFVINTDTIKTEISTLTSICNDADQVFRTGSMKDYDTYKASVDKKLKNAGIDKVIKEIDKQYKEWRKQNGE